MKSTFSTKCGLALLVFFYALASVPAPVGGASAPLTFQVALMGGAQPLQKGSVLATFENNQLRMVGFFHNLTTPWIQIELYRGDPEDGGELVRVVGITVPEGGGLHDGVDSELVLTDEEAQDLTTGLLYLKIRTLGDRSEDLNGKIEPTPAEVQAILELPMSMVRNGVVSRRGQVLGTLQGDDLRLVGYGALTATVSQVALYRGALGEPGEHQASFWLNIGSTQTTVGFDHTLPLSEALRQDLLDGLLYLEVTSYGPDKLRAQLFLSPNEAPAAAQPTTPAEGETIVIGGTGGAGPLDPAAPLFEMAFPEVQDPDGSPVAYYWQVSRVPDFGEAVTVAYDLGRGVTSFPLTVGTAAELFGSTWAPSQQPLQTPVTYYHRVISTDGTLYTYGPTATMTLVRGTITATEPEGDLPGGFVLYGNYPNPFNPSTTITFDLPATAEVRVEVFNVLGRRVLSVPAGMVTAGRAREVALDAAMLPSGSYLYRVVVEGERAVQVATGTMTLLK